MNEQSVLKLKSHEEKMLPHQIIVSGLTHQISLTCFTTNNLVFFFVHFVFVVVYFSVLAFSTNQAV